MASEKAALARYRKVTATTSATALDDDHSQNVSPTPTITTNPSPKMFKPSDHSSYRTAPNSDTESPPQPTLVLQLPANLSTAAGPSRSRAVKTLTHRVGLSTKLARSRTVYLIILKLMPFSLLHRNTNQAGRQNPTSDPDQSERQTAIAPDRIGDRNSQQTLINLVDTISRSIPERRHFPSQAYCQAQGLDSRHSAF